MGEGIEHHEDVWRSGKEEVDDLVVVLERVSGQSREEVLEAVRERSVSYSPSQVNAVMQVWKLTQQRQ